MGNNDKSVNYKEKLRQALASTIRVISEDFEIEDKLNNNKKSENFDHFDLNNLSTKNDFIKARADSDSVALKKKFSSDKIFKKNLPNKTSCKSLYSTAERIRYEVLGTKMLKGIKKNFHNNYNQIIGLKKKSNQNQRRCTNF